MDYLLPSNLNGYKEQQLHHVQAWHSATEAKLEAGRKLLAALQHSQDYPNPCSFSPADYAHYPTPEAEYPIPLLPKTLNSSENNMPVPYRHENSGASLDQGELAHPDDVLLLVGKSRQRFYLNEETLISGSAYFKHQLQRLRHSCNGGFACPPIAIDCEEHIFEGLLLLMRYGTFEALLPMSAAESFRLKKEAEYYGICYIEPSLKSSVATESRDDRSDMSSLRSQSSSPRGSPKSMTSMSSSEADKAAGRYTHSGSHHEGVRLACSTQRQLAELPQFPPDLVDPARLVLVSCLDRERASIYTCNCSSRQWALNFHHRHAFCTSCGHPLNLSPKHFAEIFMVASAQYYSSGQTAPVEPNDLWQVSSDSTCMLRFVSSAGNGPDACSSCSNGNAGAAKEAPPATIWAANCFYSHAFCTCCGKSAKGPVLLSLTLALRYGGCNKASKRSARSSFRIPAEHVL